MLKFSPYVPERKHRRVFGTRRRIRIQHKGDDHALEAKLLRRGSFCRPVVGWPPVRGRSGQRPRHITERFAELNGVRLHYLISGTGSPVVLPHGYAETSHMWLPIMPLLTERHTVIVPDLRGAGDSSKPESGRWAERAGARAHAGWPLGRARGPRRSRCLPREPGIGLRGQRRDPRRRRIRGAGIEEATAPIVTDLPRVRTGAAQKGRRPMLLALSAIGPG